MTDLLTRTLTARAARADDVLDTDSMVRAVLEQPQRGRPVGRLAVAGSVLAVGATVAGVATFTAPAAHHDTARVTTGRHHLPAIAGSPAPVVRTTAAGISPVAPGQVRPPADVWLHLNRDGTVVSYGPHGLLHPGDDGYFAGRLAIQWLTVGPSGGAFPLTVQDRPARFTVDGGRPTVTIELDHGRQISIIGAPGSRVTQQQALALVATLDLSGI